MVTGTWSQWKGQKGTVALSLLTGTAVGSGGQLSTWAADTQHDNWCQVNRQAQC